MRPGYLTLVWLAIVLGLGIYLSLIIFGEDSSAFLPGKTTDGHHQIELACDSCHTPFGGVRQQACLDCHRAELEASQDSHPEKKFADPRNAGDLARLDVRRCVTCHTEHRPELTAAMGLTLPADFCHHCHADIAEERPTHEGISFDSCASAGCHNYHDNRALYEDFLVQHGDKGPATFPSALPRRKAWVSWDSGKRLPLSVADADGPPSSAQELVDAWAGSGHAAGGVSCTDCHRQAGVGWEERPSREVCSTCHELEHRGFVAGKHGMRWSVGLDSMVPSEARLAMKPDALSTPLNCSTCHDAHAADVRHAAVDACLSCHADGHSVAYTDSPHFRLWQLEMSGHGPPGSGVSCASCHLPREPRRIAGDDRVLAQHNQNDNLRPSEKMIRGVCLQCHSLAFSLDALADPELAARNFAGLPSQHIRSIDMAVSRTEK